MTVEYRLQPTKVLLQVGLLKLRLFASLYFCSGLTNIFYVEFPLHGLLKILFGFTFYMAI